MSTFNPISHYGVKNGVATPGTLSCSIVQVTRSVLSFSVYLLRTDCDKLVQLC